MLSTFGVIADNVAFRRKTIQTDGILFRLHYRFTFCILLVCTILVCSRQYIGQHIKCIADDGIPAKVIETFCFFTSTFTVVRHLNSTGVPHPGVGPLIPDEPVIQHAYYQWVPFVLFGQALMFYIPHLVWKSLEGNQVKNLAAGFEFAALASGSKELKVGGMTIPSSEARKSKINHAGQVFLQRLSVNRYWAYGLIFCETLNLVNLILQVWAMDAFLGGRFVDIGRLLIGDDADDDWNPMDLIFPKVTKCTFHKYGPSGSIQQHDALCVMALNVMNEKIYAFLWFWFLILFVVTLVGLLYRLVSMCLFSRSRWFNRCTFGYVCTVALNPCSMKTIATSCSFSNWLLIHFLALSVDSFVFRDLFDELAKVIEDQTPKNGKLFSNGVGGHTSGQRAYLKDDNENELLKNGKEYFFKDEENQQLLLTTVSS